MSLSHGLDSLHDWVVHCRLVYCRLGLAWGVLWLLVGTAAAQSGGKPSAKTASEASASEAKVIDSGYVFIGGEYLSAPYRVEQCDAGALVNGVLIKAEQFPRVGAARGQGMGGPGPGGRRANRQDEGAQVWRGASWQPGEGRQRFRTSSLRKPAPAPNYQRRIVHRLEQDSAIIAFDDRPMIVLEPGEQVDSLLSVFTGAQPDSTMGEELLATLAPVEDHAAWMDWLSTYQPPAQLVERAQARLAEFEQMSSSNQAQIAAVRRIDQFSYPLSLVGMVLAVVASGHLLQTVPSRQTESSPLAASPHMMRFVLIAAGLVFALSTLDLAWTLLAAQAGQMRELNPLGQGLIDNPLSLVAFKFAATLMSCGLLVALRRHHSAQVAAWWLCLICTMLTFRWLMFNSMFMGS